MIKDWTFICNLLKVYWKNVINARILNFGSSDKLRPISHFCTQVYYNISILERFKYVDLINENSLYYN